MPRQKTTGRFDTRAELEERVTFMYYQTRATQSEIARACGVSGSTVDNVLTEHDKKIHSRRTQDVPDTKEA